MQTLKNKVAFITGGSRGIGSAIVKKLADLGATVSFTYVNERKKAETLVKELEEKGTTVMAIKADSAQAGEVTSAIEQTISQYKTFDILINNAGIYIGKPFEEHTLDDYDKTMAINSRAVVEACIVASRKMSENGRIISIGSNMASRVASVQGTLYSMSKSALVGLTKGLARDLGPKGITVNLVQPGSTNTDMNPENSDHADFQRRLMAIPRYGRAEHIADLVAYLASPGSVFTTGGVFTIDGGANS
jgi:3-oxoacyl-[acyl-carrier protein] reductase